MATSHKAPTIGPPTSHHENYPTNQRSWDELISDVLLWTPIYGWAKAGWPAQTYIQQLCEDMGCSPEDLPESMNDREKWRERVRDIRACGMTWWWWYGFKYSYTIPIIWLTGGILRSSTTTNRKVVYSSWILTLSNCIFVFPVSVVFFVEINRKYYLSLFCRYYQRYLISDKTIIKLKSNKTAGIIPRV